jgi:hypothetical protein
MNDNDVGEACSTHVYGFTVGSPNERQLLLRRNKLRSVYNVRRTQESKKKRSQVVASQVTRAVPVKVSRLLYGKRNTFIVLYGVISAGSDRIFKL